MNNYIKRKRKFKRERNDFRKYMRKYIKVVLEHLVDHGADPIIYKQRLHSFKHIDYANTSIYMKSNREIMKSKRKRDKLFKNINRQFHSIDEFVTDIKSELWGEK